MSTAPLLEVSGVSRTYRNSAGFFRPGWSHRAVDGVSLTIDQDEVLAIVGESGCGKSTLAHMMLGLLEPTEGEIRLEGRPITAMARKEIARRVQPVFQDPYASLNPRATVAQSVQFPLAVHGIGTRRERRQRALDVLDAVGLSRRHAESYPAQLSGGQRQRVAIARALVIRPRLLICDEPTSALDVSVQSQVLNLLIDLKRDFKLNYVLISHNLAVVEHMSARVCVMSKGRVIEAGPTARIFAAPGQEYTRMLLDSVLMPDPAAAVAARRRLPAPPPA